jgi:hypothetical protein
MTREFIPYEQALALKELGFDELCLFYYADNEALRIYHQSEIYDDLIGAPLYQQAFRWFREKFGLKGEVNTADMVWSTWSFNIELKGSSFFFYSGLTEHNYFNSYEEAQLACLNKLIEIVKTKHFA